MVQSEQHVIYRLMAGCGGAVRTKLTWKKLTKTAVSGSSLQLTLKKGSGVRSAIRAASKLPGRGPSDVDDAHVPVC